MLLPVAQMARTYSLQQVSLLTYWTKWLVTTLRSRVLRNLVHGTVGMSARRTLLLQVCMHVPSLQSLRVLAEGRAGWWLLLFAGD